MVVMSRSHNLDAAQEGVCRGVERQKYPLDDYLISTNKQARTQTPPLLSPISPLLSPETADALQNAERLVKSAQEHIMEVSFNSALNTLDENPSSYVGQQPLDDSLLYVREMVNSKFQESNDPNGIYIRKALTNNVASLNRKLQHDQFPVRESNGMLNKPLGISKQNSEFFTSQMPKGIFLHNEKPFFNKAPDWFNIKPPEHVNVFPSFTPSNLNSKPKRSCTVPCCTMTNTGVIEINGRDHLNGTIQVQTGPTVDIQRGLTIQTIENVHISPDPSSVPIYNNIGTYCFQHEPSASTSFADSNRIHIDRHSITSSTARNVFDTRKERHIQSTDYSNMHNTGTSLNNDSISPSHDTNRDMIEKQAMLTNDSKDINNRSNSNNENVDSDEIDLSSNRNKALTDSNVIADSNIRKSSIDNEDLFTRRILRGSLDNLKDGTYFKKAVGINLYPVETSEHEEFPIADEGVNVENEKEDFGESRLSEGYYEISSSMGFPRSHKGQKFQHVQSDNDYVQRAHVCGVECQTGSCSRKCERDVEYKEKRRLKEALETITNIRKLRFDLRDTGIISEECTQMCEDKIRCYADAVDSEFEPFSEPERFKTALENLCKFSQDTKASKIDTNSKKYQEAIDAFVKTFFDSNNQSNHVHGPYSADQNIENKNTALRQNKQSIKGNGHTVEKAKGEMRKEEAAKAPTQIKAIPEPKKMENHRRQSKIVKSKINNVAVNNLSTTTNHTSNLPILQLRTDQLIESNKYSKPLAPPNRPLPKDKVAQREKVPPKIVYSKEENSLENMDLKQPCVSDVDAILKTYRESMAAICQGTEQLSQLISHHIMKNALSSSDQISSPLIPNCSVILGKMNVEPSDGGHRKISAEAVSNPVSNGFSKVSGQFVSNYRQNFTDQSRIQCTKVTQQKNGRDGIRRCDYPSISRYDVEYSNENNSLCTNETPVSNRNQCSSTCGESPSEQTMTLSNSDEKSSSSTPKLDPIQHRVTKKYVRKSGENKFMNVQYCISEPFEAPIPIAVTSDKKNSPSQSGLSTYIHLENACGKDMRLRRHSNYDIHSDQSGDFNLYKCPAVLISGQRDNFDASNNDCNDELAAAKSVIQTKEIELQVFGQILDAVKNSSQFMNRFVVSLFNGMEIDSINDIIRNLEDAAVHPIVIEQLLLILKEKNKEKSLFGGNLMLTNPIPTADDWQKNYNEPTDVSKTNDNMNSFKHSMGSNGSMETTNIYINKADSDPVALHPVSDQVTHSLDPIQREMKLNFESNKDYAHSINDCNSPNNEAVENELPSGQVQCEMLVQKHIREEELKNSNDNLAISKITFERKSHPPSSTLPCGIFQVAASEDAVERQPQQDRKEASEKSLQTEHSQNNNVTSKGQSDTSECLTHSISSNQTSKKNDSKSNTDKDISFLIPHDTEMNDKVSDLCSVHKLTSMILKNETNGEIIGFQIESNCPNCLKLNSLRQERSRKINANSDPGQSSVVTNKRSDKLQNSTYPIVDHKSLIKNDEKDEQNFICHCQRLKDHIDPNIESHHVPCESSLEAVNALIDLQIQSNYKQLGLIDSEPRAVRRIPDKTTPMNERTLNKRPRPSILSATSKSPVRKANDSGKSGSKKEKSFARKVGGNKKRFHDNKQHPVKGVKNTESYSDSENYDMKHACPLCIQLQGMCSCLDCTNCITNSKRYKKISPKPKKEKERLMKNTTSPRQSGSPKRSGHAAVGTDSVRKELNSASKELSSRSTPVQPGSAKNINCKNINCNQGIVRDDKKLICIRTVKDTAFVAQKSRLKPNSGMLSSDRNNNDGLMNRKTKPRKDKKLLQDAASDSNNLKVEDKSQNTTKYEDVSVCKSTETLCKKVVILDKASLLSPRQFDKIVEVNTIDKPPVKEAGTLTSFESCLLVQDPSTDYRNTYCDRMNITEERITGSKDIMKDFNTMSSQTSEIDINIQNKPQPDTVETISESGTVSVLKTTCSNIFDAESIIVLQPLNELDHTFFIAKPNCVEKKIIQEKLNKRFNVQVKKIIDHAYSAVYELHQHHKETDIKKPTYSDGEIVAIQHVNCTEKETTKDNIQSNNANSPFRCTKNEECQAGCPGGTGTENPINDEQSSVTFAPTYVTDYNVSVSDIKEECSGSCINDEECLRICPQSYPAELNDSRSHCKQDCPNEEICLELCPPAISQAEPSLQPTSIDINVMKKFTAENDVPNVKWPSIKDLKSKKVEDSQLTMRTQNEKLGTIFKKSESQNDHDQTEIKNKGHNEEGNRRKSVQYEEPHEKMKQMMMNRKSMVLPNVVRGIADMHPSKNLGHLRIRSADPIVSGNFNKPESDRRYSVFNKSNLEGSSIDLNDPKTQAHLASIAQSTKDREGEKSSSDDSTNIVQLARTEIPKETSKTGKSDSNNKSKLNKSRRGMDADPNLLFGLNKRSVGYDNNSMKSFESSDLEPGEFLQVRTPFDKPCSGRIDLEIGEVSRDQTKCNGLCNNDENHSPLARNVNSRNTQETTKNHHKNFENEYELCMHSAEAAYIRKIHKRNSEKLYSGSVSPDKMKPIVNGAQRIVGKNDTEFGVQNHQLVYDETKNLKYITTDYSRFEIQSTRNLKNDKSPKAKNSVSIGKSSLSDLKSNMLKVRERHITAADFDSSELCNCSHTSKMGKNSYGIINEDKNIDPLQKYSELSNVTNCSNRPQIIDHFLGKTKLEDIMKIEPLYTNNKTDSMSKECQSVRGGNCQRLYLKSDFTSKTTPDLENSIIMESPDLSVIRNDAARFNFSSRTYNGRDLANSNQTTSKRWDQTSSDTYSEGEINLPSSCSYSLGEVKISTAPSSTATDQGKSFKDPDDRFTIFVTNSILDSTHATCASPGEILAEIYKTETDVSSSIS